MKSQEENRGEDRLKAVLQTRTEDRPKAALPTRELFVHMLRVRCLDSACSSSSAPAASASSARPQAIEAAIVGSAAALEPRDWLWSGLREGGAALMRGLPLSEYVAQMYCNSHDTAKGRQMCNHFQHTGLALPELVVGDRHADPARRRSRVRRASARPRRSARDLLRRRRHELERFPLAGSTSPRCLEGAGASSSASTTAGRSRCPRNARPPPRVRRERRAPTGCPGVEVDGNDVLACYEAVRAAVERARAGGGAVTPRAQDAIACWVTPAPTIRPAIARGTR